MDMDYGYYPRGQVERKLISLPYDKQPTRVVSASPVGLRLRLRLTAWTKASTS